MPLLSPLCRTLSPLGVAAGRRRGVQSEFCLGFDGVDDYVGIGNVLAFERTDSYTLAAWVKAGDSAGNFFPIIAKHNGGTGYDIGLESNTFAAHLSNNGSSNQIKRRGSTLLNNGVWHHIAVTYNGSSLASGMLLYVDGRLDSMITVNDNLSATTVHSTPLAVGARPTQLLFHRGSIDDPRIYNRALTGDEVSALYVNTTPPPTDGLVAYFPLDEGTGTTTTDSVAGLVGTFTGGPTWQPQTPPRLIAGRNTEDWSVSFDGADDYVDVAGSDTLTMTSTNQFTYTAWFKAHAPAASGYQVMLSLGVGGATINTGDVRIQGGNVDAYWHGFAAGYGGCIGSTVLVAGVWYHVAVVFVSGQHPLIYLNGIQEGSFVNNVQSFAGSDWKVRLGRSDYGDNVQFSGILKDVRIYNSALPTASIATLARGKEPSETPVARWRLNEGSGTTAADSIGSNHGTLTNGPVWTGDVPQHFRQTIESSQSGNFDGVDDDVLIPTSASQTLSSAGTVSAWVNVNSLSGVQRVFTHGQATILFMEVRINEFRFYLYDGTYKSVFSLLAPVVGSWYHLAVKFDSTTLEAFVNGISQGTVSAGPIAYDPGTDKRTIIGANVTVPFHWINGLIDEFGHYNRALSVAEVADQAAGYLVPAGLVSRFKFDGDALDAQGANNGTEEGGVGYSTDAPGTL